MRPQPFVDLLKQWLEKADHPGITGVATCAEVGRWEQPVGVRVTLGDGWAFLLQMVRTSPAGGDHDGLSVPSETWADQPAYRQARKAADQAAAAWRGEKTRKPQATAGQLLAVILETVKRADHPGITAVEVSARPGANPALRVTCVDGSTLFGLAVGWIAPGGTDLTGPAHDLPTGWM